MGTLVLSWLAVMLLPSVFTDAAELLAHHGAVAPSANAAWPWTAEPRAASPCSRSAGSSRRPYGALAGLVPPGRCATTLGHGPESRNGDRLRRRQGRPGPLRRPARRRRADGLHQPRFLATHPTVRVTAGTPPRGLDLAQGVVVPTLGPRVSSDYVPAQADDPAWAALGERLRAHAVDSSRSKRQEDASGGRFRRRRAGRAARRAARSRRDLDADQRAIATYAYPLWLL